MHYWADLQSLDGFRCYMTTQPEREMSASACTRSVPGLMFRRAVRSPVAQYSTTRALKR